MAITVLFLYSRDSVLVGYEKLWPQEKSPGTPASRTWLVSHVVRAGLEPTPDTAVRLGDSALNRSATVTVALELDSITWGLVYPAQ